jgi:hypothetical protein
VTDLADFLLARIAEDEAQARGTSDLAWTAQRRASWHTVDCGYGMGESARVGCSCHVPARVLAMCEAHKEIVAEHSFSCGSGDENGAAWRCPTLRSLALPYADHPDYREEWKR